MEKQCRQCPSSFSVTDEDLAFYERVSPTFNGKKYLIPPPTLCPSCRQQRRLTFRNERTLYKRKCDLSGKEIISRYAPGTQYKVYEREEWFSDHWDPMEYGREFDFNRPFFDQYKELLKTVPFLPCEHVQNENCEFTNLSAYNRNSYLIFAANKNEDCLYSTYLNENRDVCDCFFIFNSEQCYECLGMKTTFVEILSIEFSFLKHAGVMSVTYSIADIVSATVVTSLGV